MSTKLTRKSPVAGYELVDSHSLALTLATETFRGRMVGWLLTQLKKDGFEGLKANQLTFLGSLDCGENFAAGLARTLGISRQAVHKTIRELEGAGWLETRPDDKLGNQRVIVFTEEGERMMTRAREYFLVLDTLLLQQYGEGILADLQKLLNFDPLIQRSSRSTKADLDS
jgi:DNA-binding MarR family transcriptional regulator